MTAWTFKYLDKRYYTEHPCMALVLDVLRTEYGIYADMYNEPLTLQARKALAFKLLTASCRPITPAEVKEADIALIKVGGIPAHVGIMVNSRNVMHVPDSTMGVVIESLDSPYLKNRIEGFYRPLQLEREAPNK